MTSKKFPGFTRLSSNGNSYLYKPAEPTKPDPSLTTSYTKASPKPDLVILSAWMGAAPKHILKYTAAYQAAYPSSTILVITNEIFDIVNRPHWLQRRRIQPAAEFVHDFAKAHQGSRVLLHGFSNGGGLQVVQLGTAYRRAYGEGLPASAFAIDSAPGAARDFKEGLKGVSAIAASFPPSLKFISTPVTFLVVVMFWVMSNIFRTKNVIEQIREGLLDENVLSKDMPRVYLYSEEDKLIYYPDVERHAASAEAAGYWVEKVKFERTGHVQHMMKEPKKYWAAVSDVLNEAESRR